MYALASRELQTCEPIIGDLINLANLADLGKLLG